MPCHSHIHVIVKGAQNVGWRQGFENARDLEAGGK